LYLTDTKTRTQILEILTENLKSNKHRYRRSNAWL